VSPEKATDSDAETQAPDALKKGIEAYRKGKYDVARVALETAWSTKRSGSIAAMLAEVEMELGRYDSAATHWAYAIYNLPAAATDALAEARAKLEECKKHAGTLVVDVTPPDAEILVNGAASEYREQGNQIWVLPGAHTLTARAAGVTDEVRIQVDANETKTVHLRAAAEPPPRPPTPSPMAVDLRVPTETRRGVETRTVVALAGAGASLVALGFGVGFALHRNALGGDIDELDETLRARSPDVEPHSLCAGNAPSECEERMGTIADYNRAANRANIAFALSGGLGVATALTYVLWPSKKNATTVGDRRFTVVPAFSPAYQGLGLRVGY
jgi:tetratricopeptide (TPR) repeat protein